MAGLTDEGFTPLTQSEIIARIEGRLEVVSPGFDFDPESPDGQNIGIWSFELAQLWTQLDLVYSTFDPRDATGQGLRNVGFLSGVLKDNADRSYATIDLVGTAGTSVPANSEVSDADGNKFVTELDATIPTSVTVIALNPGPIPIVAGTLVNIDTPVSGWASFTQTLDGQIGTVAETDQSYRNSRDRAVLNPSESVADALLAKLIALGLDQVEILNNDTDAALVDGTPVGHIHITVTDTTVTDEDIALTILKYKSLGTPTFGSTAVVVNDTRGNPHTINFSKAAAVEVEMEIDITFLSTDTAGAEDGIKAALAEYVNSLLAGESVVWSRLFAYITPYGKAQVNSLTIGVLGGSLSAANLAISDTEFATQDTTNITITLT